MAFNNFEDKLNVLNVVKPSMLAHMLESSLVIIKKLLVLAFFLFTTVNSVKSIGDGAAITFNSKSFDDGLSIGFEDADYYLITVVDGDFAINAGRFIGATIYVPRALMVNGTYDLEVLKPSKESNASGSCDEDSADEFTLPSNNKVYILLSDTSVRTTRTLMTVKGTVSTDENELGSITFANLNNDGTAINLDVDFDISTKVSNYTASVPLDETLTCEQLVKKIKVKYAKNVKTSAASGDFSTTIILDGGDDTNFRRLPIGQLIPVKY